MARIPSVETRINAILDSGRPLARRLGAAGIIGLLAIGIPAVICAAALRPGAETSSEVKVVGTTEGPSADNEQVEVATVKQTEREASKPLAASPDPQSQSVQTGANERSALKRPFIYEGQVLTPDGNPSAGAKLHLVYWYSYADSSKRHNPVAVTGEDGRFRFEMSRDDFHRTGDSMPPWQWASLVAVADGYGLAWAHSLAFEKTGAVIDEMSDSSHPAARDMDRLRKMIEAPQGRLRLARDDVPIRGTIVDTEGQPIAGARIRLLEVYQGQDGTLDAWMEAAGKPGADFYSVRQAVPYHLYGPLAQNLTPTVETDENGRFSIEGIGRERLVRLLVEAPHSEWTDVYCRTRPGDTLEIGSGMPERNMIVHAPQFSHVVAPSKPIVGVVRDESTGEPLAGVTVQSHEQWVHTAPGKMTRGGNDFSRTVTDEDGEYELLGLPRSQYNDLAFTAPEGMPYLPTTLKADTRGTDVEPVAVDAELVRGHIVTGRVTDAETGRGVSGHIAYLVSDENPAAETLRKNVARREDPRVDIEGNFRVVVPPGPGYLAFAAFGDAYEKKASRPEGASPLGLTLAYVSMSGTPGPEYHALARLNSEDDVSGEHIAMQVSRGKVIPGTILGPDGDPLDGGQYAGRTGPGDWRPIHDGKFMVVNYHPAKPRRVTFVHRDKQLAGTCVLQGKLGEVLHVHLQPWGTVTGRVVDERGDPIPDLVITPGRMAQMMPTMASPDEEEHPNLIVPLPPTDDYRSLIKTDDDGRFTIDGLVPGEKYDLSGFQRSGIEARQMGDIATGVVVEPGQALDLGDLQLQEPDYEALRREAERREDNSRKSQDLQENTKEAPMSRDAIQEERDGDATFHSTRDATGQPASAPVAADTEGHQAKQDPHPGTIQVTGTVFAPDGQPLEGARLYWPRTKTPEPRRPDDMYLEHVASSASDGSFSAELIIPSVPWRREAPLLAIADGFGMAWCDIFLTQSPEEMTLQMAEEFPISGRILTTEGSPVPGANIGLHSVMTDSSGSIDKLLTAWKSEWRSSSMKVDRIVHMGLHLVGGLLGNEPADEQGRFTIRGLGKEHAVWLNVSAPSIAKGLAIVITREGFQADPYNQAALAQAGRMALRRRQTPKLYANDLTIVAESGKEIVGRVTDIDSGEPLEGVVVDTSAGYGGAIMSTTDANGNYRLAGIPLHDGDVLISFRRPRTRYLPRTLATKLTPGLAAMEFDAGLAKGVVLKGRVTETETGKPVSGGIRFAPLEDNAWKDRPGYDNYKRSRVMETVDQDGRFEFISIPGPGVLLMQAGASGIEIGGQYVKPYRKGQFSEEDREKVRIYVEGESFYTSSEGLEFFENGMKVVDVPENVEEYTANLTVDRGMDVDVAIVDDQGQPLTGTMVCGVTESWPITYTAPESSIRIYALDPDDPRNVIFYHRQRQLACALAIRGDEEEPVVARLQPTKTLLGRAIDTGGQPLVGAKVNVRWSDDTSREFQRQLNMTREPVTTNEDGRFRIEGAMPGVFRLTFTLGSKRYSTDTKLDDVRTIASTLIPLGGSEIALGDITVKAR